jgi:diguanylate cyclase (GGDEF)-like protein/PAS domain S-box-containing protein
MSNDYRQAVIRFIFRHRYLRTHIVMLVVVTVLPILGVALFGIWQAAASYRQTSINHLSENARTLARSVEGDLLGRETLLRTLAMASSVERDETRRLQYWLDSAAPGLGTLSILSSLPIVSPPDSAASASATPPPDFLRTVLRESTQTGRPILSNLYFAGPERTPKVALGIVQPSPESMSSAQVLSLVLSPDRLIKLAPQVGSSETSLLAAVVDGTGRIVARSRDSQRFVGKPVPDWNVMKALPNGEHVFQAKTAEGPLIIFSYEELAGTPGWVLVVGEPLAAFNARWRQPLWDIVVGGGITLLMALLLAGWLTRYILRSVDALEHDARNVIADDAAGTSTPQEAPFGGFRIREFESLRLSIEAAQAALKKRALKERQSGLAVARSELRYRTLAHTGSLVLWRADADMRLTSATGWEVLTGEAEANALGRHWLRRVHPNERRSLQSGITNGGQQFDIEFRIVNAEGSWQWVRARASLIAASAGQNAEWVGVVEDVHERRQVQDRITYMALHDALTGLPNRTELSNRLEAAIRRASRGEFGAVLYIDLDRFKEVNDTLGHPVGDALLRAVTQRLLLLAREVDTVARLGGDEFVFVCSQISSLSDAAIVAQRIVDALSAVYELNEHQVTIGASVGIMPISNGSDDADRLLKCADMALYRAKHEGRGRYHFFDQNMDARMQARKKMERQLRRAVVREEFELHYQPIIDVRSRVLNGVEAAVHWNHPDQGKMVLKDFSALVEELQLTSVLHEWILTRACVDLANWPSCPKVIVNATASWINHSSFAQTVKQVLERSGLAAGRLELAVDESTLLEEPQQILAELNKVRALGVRVAMDNFGASYSSMLDSLRSVPFDKVKFEPMIFHSISHATEWDVVHRAMAKICGSLGIMVAADGVDDEAKLNLLYAENCIEAQGNLFGGFMPASDVLAMTESKSGTRPDKF